MKEDFLNYIWLYKKFELTNLVTTQNQELTIVNSGLFLENAGPDFFNAQIVINNQKWAGNVEIHVKSSDWYLHKHELDKNYDNVILHVVWENDTEIFRKDNSIIPVLELKNYVSKELVYNYTNLLKPKSWIYCEKNISAINSFTFNNWLEKLFIERLESKSKLVFDLLKETNNNWEAILFMLLTKSFGLNTNGDEFFKLAKQIPFNVIRKESFDSNNIEALLFGFLGFLDNELEDVYCKDLITRWNYLKAKHQLNSDVNFSIQFFKLRPDNFPTIRLSQLAQIYNLHQNLFNKIIECKSTNDVYKLFNVKASEYWKTHYVFDKSSVSKDKKLSKSFVDLVIINTVIPIKFAYAQSQGKENIEDLISILTDLKSEKNVIIDKFNTFGIKSLNAFYSQSLLELKNNYCNKNRCLKCAVGQTLIKES